MKNPRYNHRGTIDGEIEVDGETVTTTAAPGDTLYDEAITGKYGNIEPYEPPQITAQQAYQQKIRQINAWLESELKDDYYSQKERETWRIQLQEAQAFSKDKSASTPFLDALAKSSGRKKAQLSQSAIDKDQAYIALVADKLGSAQRLRNIAKEALENNDAATIQAMEVGLPVK